MQLELYMASMSYDKPRHWMEDAACIGADPTLFDIFDEGSKGAHKFTANERIAITKRRFDQAEEICLSCPVMVKCGQESTVADRTWVYRAGKYPGYFSGTNQGRPALLKRNENGDMVKVCSNGHERSMETRRCNKCRREREAPSQRSPEHNAKRRERRRAKRDGVPSPDGV